MSRGPALLLIYFLHVVQSAAVDSSNVLAASVDCASPAVAIVGEALLQTKHTVVKPAQHGTEKIELASADRSWRDVNAQYRNSFDVSSSANHNHLQLVQRTRRNTSTFFYHFHMPRTGGTTVANLMLAHLCKPFQEDLSVLGWADKCTQTCDSALVENEFVCPPVNDERWEHQLLGTEVPRVTSLALHAGAVRTVFVTTLRRGPSRFISEWLFNVRNNAFSPPPGIDPKSNESLLSFLSNSIYGPSVGPNLQVAYLASVPFEEWFNHTVTQEELHRAQQSLLSGPWVIGFAECMEQLSTKLSIVSSLMYGISKPKKVPLVSQSIPGLVTSDASEAGLIQLDSNTKAVLETSSAFDNALYAWAQDLANAGADDRFTATC